MSGRIDTGGDVDLVRFAARRGEALVLEVNAARSGSKLDSRVEVLHADGRPVERVALQATRDSWFTFRGKDSTQVNDFRVHNWREMELDEYLYANGDMLTFMDMQTYDQIELAADFVGDQAVFLQDGMKTLVQMYEDKPIGIKLPVQVTLTVTEADPVLKGGTAAPSYKSAVLENGLKIQVPPFIDAGEKIIVATEDGSYVRRAE